MPNNIIAARPFGISLVLLFFLLCPLTVICQSEKLSDCRRELPYLKGAVGRGSSRIKPEKIGVNPLESCA
jgi:hypothetical protein